MPVAVPVAVLVPGVACVFCELTPWSTKLYGPARLVTEQLNEDSTRVNRITSPDPIAGLAFDEVELPLEVDPVFEPPMEADPVVELPLELSPVGELPAPVRSISAPPPRMTPTRVRCPALLVPNASDNVTVMEQSEFTV